jgi:hypothetical protein
MDRKYFQTRKIGSFPIAAIVEDLSGRDALDIFSQNGTVFILQVLEYDHESRRLHVRLKPGNGMVPVVAMKEASGVKDCE